jgi:hypothetical protein
LIIIPAIHSSRRGRNSDLAAALAMAIAYARGDVSGEMYRDQLEIEMGERAVEFVSGVQIARSMFPDIPMPTYDAFDLHIADVLTLVRLAVQRRSHLVPVLAVNLERLDNDGCHGGTAFIALRELTVHRRSKRTLVAEYWDPGAPPGHESLEPDEASLVAAYRECAIIGRLPPAW